MATEKNFQATDPAPPANARNVTWQVDPTAAGADATTGQPYFNTSAYMPDMVGDTGSGGSDGLVPAPPAGSAAASKFLKADGTWASPGLAIGGVSTKTANYTAVSGDDTKLISFNSAGAVQLTLPATPPSPVWFIAVQDIGAGALTITPNGLNLDGAAGSLVLSQNSGVFVFTDGTNYFTERGLGTITSIALSMPSEFSVAGSPLTGPGTITVTKANESANTAYMGPASGSPAAPTFRSLVAADLPASGVTAGTYNAATVTVDAEGRVTAASNGSLSGPGLIQLLQFKSVTSSSGTLTAAFTSAVKVGSTIVVEYWGAGNTTAISDTQSNIYTQYNAQNWASLIYISQFVALNVVAGSVTVTMTGAGSTGYLNIYEYANVDLVDVSGSTISTITPLAQSITTTYPTDVVHMMASVNVGSSTLSNTDSWPLIQSETSGPSAVTISSYYTTIAAAGSVSNTLNATGAYTHSYIGLLALKPRPVEAAPVFQTGGTNNAAQGVLNLTAGANVTLTNTGSSVSIASSGGGGSGSLVFLEAHTASSSASLAFTSWYSSSYDDYLIEIVNLVPATNSVSVLMRMSTNGGSTYDSGSNYGYASWRWIPGGSTQSGSDSTTSIVVDGGAGTDLLTNTTANGGLSGSGKLFNPGSATMNKLLTMQTSFFNTASHIEGATTSAWYKITTAVNAFEILMSSGNIASGVVRIYGISH